MGTNGARCSMNTKGALRKILSTLHPNTILKPNLDSSAHPPTLSVLRTLHLTLIKTEYWDRAGGGGNIRYEW